MRKIRFCVVITALLVCACSGAKAVEAETQTPSASTEISATGSDVSKVVVEPDTGATGTSVEAPGVGQPSEEIGETTVAEDAPDANQTVAVDTPNPTDTPTPAVTSTAEEMDEKTTPEASVEEMPTADTADKTPEASTTESITTAETPLETPTRGPAQTLPVNAPAARLVYLERIPDTDPAPPLTILVSAIQIKENGYYKLTGTVRNDSSDVYGGVGVVATFYEEEKPCSEGQVTRRGRDGSEEIVTVEICDYNWHGPVRVYAACMLVEPGAECPFSLEIYPEDYISYLLHPEGAPVQYRQPAPLALSNLNVQNNGLGYVRITGTAINGNAFSVRDAHIAGTLMNAVGQIVSVGSIVVPGQIAPGASVAFDLRIEYTPYATYELHAQATQN